MKTMNLDDVMREVAAVITNFELVQDFVLDGDMETAKALYKALYKATLEQAKKFGYRLATQEINQECGAVFNSNY